MMSPFVAGAAQGSNLGKGHFDGATLRTIKSGYFAVDYSEHWHCLIPRVLGLPRSLAASAVDEDHSLPQDIHLKDEQNDDLMDEVSDAMKSMH
ncbi:hypothetical protein N7471_013480 [Penicillium samsonianum]|uniref:uncharacterized protein n=1 Tax=Penicillium samsonianum TaxID=1882272 RepID=UPI0025499393|nr:uncharacterized protein N7471_013480 [Penicillium samsonianum]KAJ6118860.1 hypothetical protein N7471_013480 [Penicillium samsonianum]